MKKLISMLLVICMCITLVPQVFAADVSNTAETYEAAEDPYEQVTSEVDSEEASDALVTDEAVIDEAVIDEEIIDEEVIDEEVIDEEAIDEEIIDEEIIDEEIIDEEIIDEEIIDEEIIDEEIIDEEIIDEETIDEETIDEEIIDEEAIDEEIIDEEVIDEAVIDEEAIDEEAIDEEAIDEEIIDEEVIDEEIIDEEIIDEEIIDEEAAEEIETEVSEDETYMLNIVLFALEFSADLEDIEYELDDLGLSHISPVFTDEDGNAIGIGKKKEVWYRAYTPEDVYETVDALMNIDGVTYSEPEYVYTPAYEGMCKEYDRDRDWVHHKHHYKNDKFWWKDEYKHDYAPGYGTIVAVIDTGVDYTHEDLASNMWVNTAELDGVEGVDDDLNGYIDDIYGADTTASGKKAGNPMDDHGHGTHVAGIIGMAANGTGGVGFAYGAKIMAVKAGQSTGTLASSHIAKAINYAHMMGADVINMSFGGTMQSYLVETALEDAFADCVLVASAGNDGLPTTDAPTPPYFLKEDIYPAGYSYVIGVMASTEDGGLASFSNWDYMPNANCEYEIAAPGVDIYSTLPGDRYAKWSGTSMAAPFVSAAAAILRSHYDDKDMYSSRFIMGQLASATTDTVAGYPALNLYDSIYYLPKPNIAVKETFLMDNVSDDTTNDGDAIVEAGEVIDLGILIRNQWGLTGDIVVTADAISVGGVENPWIEFITDEVILEPAGTFQEVDNGFIWDDSYLEAVGDPIRFKVSHDTPNDTEIKINITVTTTNGIDEDDDTIYTLPEPYSYTFRVQAGRGIKGILAEDTTLTKDYLWIIEDTLFIPEGITLTIEPGTKVQFWSSDYEDTYGQLTMAKIVNDGTLIAEGTEDEPIEMYPGAGFENYAVEIRTTTSTDSKEYLKYCNIINPFLASDYEYYGHGWGFMGITSVNHCQLIQNQSEVYFRYYDSNIWNYSVQFQTIQNISDSYIVGLEYPHYFVRLAADNVENCVFEACKIKLEKHYFNDQAFNSAHILNSVFLIGENNNNYVANIKSSYLMPSPKITFDETVYTYDGSESKYVFLEPIPTSFIRDYNGEYIYEGVNYYIAKAYAESLGGTVMCINDDEELEFLENTMREQAEATREAGYTNSIYRYVGVGYTYNKESEAYEWDDESDYSVNWSNYHGHNYAYRWVISYPESYHGQWEHSYAIGTDTYYALEFSAELSDEEIIEGLGGITQADVAEYLEDIYVGQVTNNAILNPVLNTAPDNWTIIKAEEYVKGYAYSPMRGNYWGTENKTLINKMISDADDYAGSLMDIKEDPILTLESESLEDIYPFVTKVYLTDEDGNILTHVQPGGEYEVHVHFNRDMDMDTQPSISYGPATPYTDYMVDGEFVSEREWVGTTRISPVLTSGTMFWRTKGGCAADDNWLVCGEDVLRFSFEISTNGVLAMLLNAEGGANKVDLSWAQNDYETLAGYNIYRSESEDGYFEKINVSVLTGTEYTDTDVDPGVMYYYYFKVVNTDGNEEASVSNTASAAPIDNIAPVLNHSPIASAKAGNQITVSATATDNIGVESVTLYYRKGGDSTYKSKEMTLSATANLYVSVIPAEYASAAGVEYYVIVKDADGNIDRSGSEQIPNIISVNTTPYISGMTPSKINIGSTKQISILGGNFTEDMTLKVGSVVIEDKEFVDAGHIKFTAPSLSSGSYAVTLTSANGTVYASPASLSYADAESIAQIPTHMTLTSGVEYVIPFYAEASGDIVSLHAELDLPYSDFTSVRVEKADENASFMLEQTYKNGVLKIGAIGTEDISAADGAALLNIIVKPRVTENKQYVINLHDVSFNGVPVTSVISGNAVFKPSYAITANVNYYAGDKAGVKGVTISAAGVNQATDANGTASLTVAEQSVKITAVCSTLVNAISAFDASLVLQSAVDSIELSDNQKLAADVDGNGIVDEYDAALILQKAVRKIDTFPSSNVWVFVPAFIERTLSATSTNTVTFTAILVGDVDGSYKGDAE